MRRSRWMVLVALLVPAAASAQSGGVLVSGLGGATVGTTSGPFVAGRVAGEFASGIQPFGEIGWVGDALPNSFRDFIDEVIDEFGVGPVDFDLRLRALYGLFGVRWAPPSDARVRPYVEGGLGMARLSASFTVRVGGVEFTEDDVPFGVPTTETEPAVGFGGGALVPLTLRMSLDLGYRYVFISSGEDIHLHKLLGGLRVRF